MSTEPDRLRGALAAARDALSRVAGDPGQPLDALASDDDDDARQGLAQLAEQLTHDLATFLERYDAAGRLADARERWSAEGLTATAARLDATLRKDPRRAARPVVEEVLQTLVTVGPAPAELLVDRLREAQREGEPRDPSPDDPVAALDALLRAIEHDAAAEVEHRAADLQKRAYGWSRRGRGGGEAEEDLAVLRAFAFMRLNRNGEAEQVLEDRVRVRPTPRMRAELAATLLWRGEVDEARRHALVDAGDDDADPTGDCTLALGLVAEVEGDLETAARRFAQAFARWPATRLAYTELVSMRRESGLYWRELASARLAAGLPEEALAACAEAFAQGVRGPESFPDKVVHRVRARALEQVGRRGSQLWCEATLEVAKRGVWRGLGEPTAVEEAIRLLEELIELDPPPPTTGWYLAEALRLRGWFGGMPPGRGEAYEAERVWVATVPTNPPTGPEESWVYWSGANIAEDLAATSPVPADTDPYAVPRVPHEVWDALVRAEKALLLEPSEPSYWATAARLLYGVGLTVAAREARRRALEIGPDNAEARFERLKDLTRSHEPLEALEALAELDDLSPGERLVRAWCRIETDDLDGAEHDLVAVQQTAWFADETSWYVDALWASLHQRRTLAGVDDVPAAREALARLAAREGLTDDAALYRLNARLLLDGVDGLDDDLRLLATHERVDRRAHLVVAEAVRGNDEAALAYAAEMPRLATRPGELEDAHDLWTESAALLGADPATAHAARTLERARALVRDAEVDPPGDDAEQLRLVDEYEDDTGALVALTAVHARRLRERGSLDEAADWYRRLAASPFGPDALRALHDVQRARLAEAVAEGDVGTVRLLHEVLARDDVSPYPTAAMALAEAYDNRGDPEAALDVLRESAQHPDPSTCAQVNLWLAMREAADSPQLALASTRAAEQAVQLVVDPPLAARVSARLAVLLAATNAGEDEVVAHLGHALDALAADPDSAFALEFEVRRSVAWVPGTDRDLLHRAYVRACHEAGKEPVPWGLLAHDEAHGGTGPPGLLD